MTDTDPGANMAVSVIVCTRNRSAILQACLKSIETAAHRLSPGSVELIVVDNGSTDDTAAMLSRFADECALPFKHVFAAKTGLSVARNAGVRSAAGEILVFTDDDCRLSPGYLAELLGHYERDTSDVMRGGRVMLGDEGDMPITIKLSETPERFSPSVPPGGFILGCNMAVPRRAAQRIGEFDERFGAGGPLRSAEDTDFLVRAYLLGIGVEYVPDMTVVHNHGRRDREKALRLFRDYSVGNGALIVKHGRAAPWLIRQLYWTARSSTRELFGGQKFWRDLDVSHGVILRSNLTGAMTYAGLTVKDSLGRMWRGLAFSRRRSPKAKAQCS